MSENTLWMAILDEYPCLHVNWCWKQVVLIKEVMSWELTISPNPLNRNWKCETWRQWDGVVSSSPAFLRCWVTIYAWTMMVIDQLSATHWTRWWYTVRGFWSLPSAKMSAALLGIRRSVRLYNVIHYHHSEVWQFRRKSLCKYRLIGWWSHDIDIFDLFC